MKPHPLNDFHVQEAEAWIIVLYLVISHLTFAVAKKLISIVQYYIMER